MKICLACGNLFEANDFRCPVCGHSPELRDGYPAFSPELAVGNNGFKTGFFSLLAKLEVGNFWFESRNRLLTWALGRYFPQTETFLEIGGGTGFVLSGIRKDFQDIELFGSDIFSEGFTYTKDRVPEARFFQMDARQIPFDAEFDAIGAFDVLEHIDEDCVVLQQMFRAVKPGGGVILTVPQHQFLWSAVDEYSFHKRRYTRKDLIKKLKDADFQIVYITSFAFFLLPIMFLSRIKRQLSSNKFDPMAELRIGQTTNTVLENVMTVERVFIKHGFSFPAGGSLLVIAKRHSGR